MTEANRRANADAEIQKFRSSLAAADQLLATGLFDDATSRLYYAVFHLASAALLSLGIEATSHRSLLSLFAQHLVRPGRVSTASSRLLSNLFGLRNQSDYNRHFLLDEAGAREERAKIQSLIDELLSFLKGQGYNL